jgi:hypothetical protein
VRLHLANLEVLNIFPSFWASKIVAQDDIVSILTNLIDILIISRICSMDMGTGKTSTIVVAAAKRMYGNFAAYS